MGDVRESDPRVRHRGRSLRSHPSNLVISTRAEGIQGAHLCWQTFSFCPRTPAATPDRRALPVTPRPNPSSHAHAPEVRRKRICGPMSASLEVMAGPTLLRNTAHQRESYATLSTDAHACYLAHRTAESDASQSQAPRAEALT